MVTIKTQALADAVERSKDGVARLAYKADISPETLKRVLDGKDVLVSSIDQAADFLGFETVIDFVPKSDQVKA